MKPLRWLDRTLIGEIERAAHQLQKAFGWKVNCYRLAAGSTSLYASLFLGAMLADHHTLGRLWTGIVATAMPLVAIGAIIGAQIDERLALARLLQGIANPRKIARDEFFSRLVNLSFTGWFLYMAALSKRDPESVVVLVAFLFSDLGMFLRACDPLPPAPSRLRQWWHSLLVRPVPVEVTNV